MTRRHGANRPDRGEAAAAAADESPQRATEVDAAAQVVQQARAALERAEHAYRQSVQRVSQQASRARALTVGDMIDSTLEFVRRHPATGLMVAGVVGFLVGRATRR